MKVSLDLGLKDVPGQLVKALEPIANAGGNIISIVHLREEIRGGRVPVHVVFEVEGGKLEKILGKLERQGIWVSRVGEVKKKQKITIVIIGHVVDTDVRDTIDRINEIEGAMVATLALGMPHPEKESSASVIIEISNPKKVKAVMRRIEDIAKKKNLLVIKSLEA